MRVCFVEGSCQHPDLQVSMGCRDGMSPINEALLSIDDYYVTVIDQPSVVISMSLATSDSPEDVLLANLSQGGWDHWSHFAS